MFWELLATVFAGFAGAGLALLANKITRGSMPKSAMPVTAGVFMLVFAVWSEMNWFPRSVEQLPETVVVVRTNESRSPFRPWTYVTPFVNRFIAADTGAAQSNTDVPHQRIVDIYLLERWQPARALKIGLDCARPAQTPLEASSFDDAGAIVSEAWEQLAPDDPLVTAVCPPTG
ncbi:hypothetical protein [Primorskyibacter sp. S187A]|uniref:hypothetical protein n=1 Tax=Primorskyibacter sp. S187A TaxID=3415130 RepID=UPI003C7DE6F0